MTINEMFQEFANTTDHNRKVELYELIKAEQIKQEQAMIAIMYPNKD